jgi:hypothetical protein
MNAEWVEPDAFASRAASRAWGGVKRQNRPRAARRAWLVLGLAAIAAIAVLLSPSMRRRVDAPVAPNPMAPLAEFQSRSDLPALFNVKAIGGGEAASAYDAEIRASDGARKDSLTLGDPFAEGPFLRATARVGGRSGRSALFFVEVARQAAELGEAVARASNPEIGEGALYSDVTLEAGGRQRACLAFRVSGPSPNDFAGLACGGAGQAFERASLACLISRIQPTGAGATAGLDQLLKALADRRSAC